MRPARRWQRPYAHRELWVVAAVIMLVGGVLVTPVLDDEMPRVEAAVIIAIALGLAARVVHTGLFIGPLGVRIRTMWRTSTYDWLHIDDFATVRNPERYPDRYPARPELVLRLANGTTVPTPIAIQRRGRNWRERNRFARHEFSEPTRPLMGSRSYEKVVAALRHRLAEARAGESTW